jgi:hypothetical protein
MDQTCRPCWANCALTPDPEILEIDAMEDSLGSISRGAREVRALISTLELCHHKAHRWLHNIIESIGAGKTNKGLGTRGSGPLHDAERIWMAACDALEAWCAGCPADAVEGDVGGVPASGLVSRIGDRTPLKEWQIRRVIEKIRSLVHFPPSTTDPSAGFTWLLLATGEDGYSSTYRPDCPPRFAEHEDFWRTTARTLIHDSQEGRPAPMSLGLAIDMLWPCHWDFVKNLEIVLDAIGGELEPDRPYAACGRNIGLLPDRERFERVSRTLRAFCDDRQPGDDADPELLRLIGEPAPEKRWLAASLDKTIRLQLDLPEQMREYYMLPGPSWIHEPGGEPAPDRDAS